LATLEDNHTLHHVDVHVSDLAATKRLFAALAPGLGYELRSEYDEFISYWRTGRQRPVVGFLLDTEHGSATMRLAFDVAAIEDVDRLAEVALRNGATAIEGPGFHPEYGDDYYAVFFEDMDGNRYEICREE
jgi:predicted lactoylglutathione lyase